MQSAALVGDVEEPDADKQGDGVPEAPIGNVMPVPRLAILEDDLAVVADGPLIPSVPHSDSLHLPLGGQVDLADSPPAPRANEPVPTKDWRRRRGPT